MQSVIFYFFTFEASHPIRRFLKSSNKRAAMQLSKFIFAAALAAGATAQGQHAHKRDTTKPVYSKVNRDSEYGAPQAPASFSSPSSYTPPAPAPSYSAPAPAPSYSAPAPSYSAPASSYSAPSTSYAAPASSYGAPAASYGAPAASYGAPEASYGAPVYEEETGKGIDLTSIIIPILALIGLSLLFPTYVSLTTVRKKRSADEAEGESAYFGPKKIEALFLSIIFAAAETSTHYTHTLLLLHRRISCILHTHLLLAQHRILQQHGKQIVLFHLGRLCRHGHW